jgi:Na+/H+ antiporter NhaA
MIFPGGDWLRASGSVPGEAVSGREEDAVPEDGPPAAAHYFSGRTAWARNLQTPLRVFLRTETGSAAVLVGMTVAALAWVNIDASSYAAVWGARLSVRLDGAGVSLDLREWVNSALMTFFFFVFGLVRAENLVHGSDQQSCPFGVAGVMISDHVPAVRVPTDYACRRGVAAVAA